MNVRLELIILEKKIFEDNEKTFLQQCHIAIKEKKEFYLNKYLFYQWSTIKMMPGYLKYKIS
jgi:hypothetical protein